MTHALSNGEVPDTAVYSQLHLRMLLLLLLPLPFLACLLIHCPSLAHCGGGPC